MLDHEYQSQIQRISATFGKTFGAGERMDIVWRYACDLSEYEFQRICDHFITTFKTGPLPQDFINAIRNEKRLKEIPVNTNEIKFLKLDCAKCDDIGVLRVVYFDNSFQTLMRCDCRFGDQHNENIPRWDNYLSQVFKMSKVPSDFFKPDIKDSDSDKKAEEKIWNKVMQWKGKLGFAKQYWIAETKKSQSSTVSNEKTPQDETE